jgi:hypothetical protein
MLYVESRKGFEVKFKFIYHFTLNLTTSFSSLRFFFEDVSIYKHRT